MDGQNVSGVYHPRKPKDSPLWHLLEPHFDEFEQVYEDRFVREYGFYRQVISDVVRGYLKCGDLADGFARVCCPDCHHEYLLAFSCRGRWLCPSCHAKKVVPFGQHLRDNLLYPVPHRQYVFSIPIILRTYFKYDRKLLGKLCLRVNKCLLEFFRTATGLKDGILGVVMAIQTFGDYARWHPHYPCPVGGRFVPAKRRVLCNAKDRYRIKLVVDNNLKSYILASPYGDVEQVDKHCFDVVGRKIKRLRAGPIEKMIGAIDL
jgi:hypothetical protein